MASKGTSLRGNSTASSTSTATQSQIEYSKWMNGMTYFGALSKFSGNCLPTLGDVLRYIYLLHNDHLKETKQSVSLKSFIGSVSMEILKLWKHTDIPFSSLRDVERKVSSAIDQHLFFVKDNTLGKLEPYLDLLDELFDIACCKCDIEKSKCKCFRKEFKIPDSEKAFIIDQRGPRKLLFQPQGTTRNARIATKNTVSGSKYMSVSSDEDSLDEPLIPTPLPPCTKTLNLQNYAMVCERFGVPDHSAAQLASILFKNFNVTVIDENEREMKIDESTIRSEREKGLKELRKENYSPILKAFSFEYRAESGHMVVLRQPSSIYLGHIACAPDSTGSEKADALIRIFRNEDLNLKYLIGACCSAESTNTRGHDGILRSVELHVKKPLHWFVCLLEFNDRLLQHLFTKLDECIDGPIAKALFDCETKQVVLHIMAIPLETMPPNMQMWKLSAGEKYLMEMAQAIGHGSCSTSLANVKPGPIQNARQLILASRILRLYAATASPSTNLKALATYIMKVYVPMYFGIKFRSSCAYGSVHFAEFVTRVRYLPREITEMMKEAIQENAYFAHPENVLLAMICDENQNTRQRAYEKILLARKKAVKSDDVRPFELPHINFECSSYQNIIDWNKTTFVEPSFTRSMSNEDINQFMHSHLIVDDLDIPCHIEATETQQIEEEPTRLVSPQKRKEASPTVMKTRNRRQKSNRK